MIIDVTFTQSDQTFDVCFTASDQSFQTDFGEIQTVTEFIGGETYDGTYSVTPKVDAQTLPTKGKVMVEDVSVKAIPIYEVSNSSGGTTVYIAREVT